MRRQGELHCIMTATWIQRIGQCEHAAPKIVVTLQTACADGHPAAILGTALESCIRFVREPTAPPVFGLISWKSGQYRPCPSVAGPPCETGAAALSSQPSISFEFVPPRARDAGCVVPKRALSRSTEEEHQIGPQPRSPKVDGNIDDGTQ